MILGFDLAGVVLEIGSQVSDFKVGDEIYACLCTISSGTAKSCYGIKFIETPVSYTSQSSFLDGDDLPKYGEKPSNWKPSGKRIKRGLYRTASHFYINADTNASANIIRKVSRTLGCNLNRLCRGVLTRPTRINL